MGLIRLAASIRGAGVAAFRRALIRPVAHRAVPPTWTPPRGEHAVGIRDAMIAGLGATGAEGAIRIWYPAVPGTGRDPRPYFGDPAEQTTMERGLRGLLTAPGARALGARRTASRPAAVPAVDSAPVVVFSHGFTGYVGQNTHLCEQLASAGYVVVSVAYPGGAATIAGPDGSARIITGAERRRLSSEDFLRAALDLLASRSPEEEDAVLARAAAIRCLAEENARWSAHLTAVLDALVPTAEREHRVDPATAQVLATGDWSRIALVGMSFGGSTSANVAHADHRIAAAVNLDGLQQGDLLHRHDIRVPLLVMSSAGSLMPSGRTINDGHYDADGPRASVRRVLVPDAGHYAFTDLVEFGAGRVRRLLGLGTVDPERMLALVAETTQDFLDEALRPAGAGTSAGRDRMVP